MSDTWRMDRLTTRADGLENPDLPDPGESLIYDAVEQRLILTAGDGTELGRSVPFVRDENLPLTTLIERVPGGAIIRARQGDEWVC